MRDELSKRILEQGDHACLIYDKDPAELMEALVPYIKEGLEEGERCIYVADDQTIDEVARALEAGSIDVQRESKRGALWLWTRREWHQPGELDSARKSLQVRRLIDQALKAGFKGVRFAVEMTWSLEPDISVEQLKHWEATINTIFVPGVPGRIVCQYNKNRLSASAVQAGLKTHPIVILDDLCANLFYEAPLILERKSETEKLDWMISRLKNSHLAEKEHEKEIQDQSRALLAAIVESCDDAVVSKSLDGIITSWNKGAERIFGYPAQEVIGRSITVIIPPELHDDERSILERLRRGERIEHYETVRMSKDGRAIYVSLTISPVRDARGRVVGASKVAKDITLRRRMEEALRQSEEKLRKQAQELEQQLIASGRLVSLGEITASMAHEFNNPLGIAMGFAEDLLSEKDPSSPDYQALKIIHAETKRCEKIIRELLQFARPRAADFGPTDVRSLIAGTVELVGNRLYKQKVEADTRIEDNLPEIHADRQQLEQVLVNLFLNAIDAMPEGGKLSVEGKLDHSGAEAAGEIVISISDSGMGIDPEDLPRIFQPFFSARKQRGMGLGLSICDRIIKHHGGKIEAESRPHQGTTFRVYLPVEQEKLNRGDLAAETTVSS